MREPKMGNINIIGRAISPFIDGKYKVELEFFNANEGKKTVRQRLLNDKEDLQPFREAIFLTEEVGIMRESGIILTAVRIYKGYEIIYDKYCINGELNTLLDYFKQK